MLTANQDMMSVYEGLSIPVHGLDGKEIVRFLHRSNVQPIASALCEIRRFAIVYLQQASQWHYAYSPSYFVKQNKLA